MAHNTEESPTSPPSVSLASKTQSLLQIEGISFKSAKEIVEHIATLAPEDQYAFEKRAAAQLLLVQDATEEEIQYFGEYLNASKAHTFADLSAEEFQADNESFFTSYKAIVEKRKIKAEAFKRLVPISRASERGKLLFDHLASLNLGDDASAKAAQLFVSFNKSVPEIIAILNSVIWTRITTKVKGQHRSGKGLVRKDIVAAIDILKRDPEAKVSSVPTSAQMQQVGVRWSRCGLYEQGKLDEMDPPAFEDENERSGRSEDVEQGQPKGRKRSGEIIEPASSKRVRALEEFQGDQDADVVEIVSTNPESRLLHNGNDNACSCNMAESWKEALHSTHALEWPTQELELLSTIITSGDGAPIPCLACTRTLSTRLSMIAKGVEGTELLLRLRKIWDIAKNEKTLTRAICDKRTASFFLPNQYITSIREQHSLGLMKFAPVPALDGADDEPNKDELTWSWMEETIEAELEQAGFLGDVIDFRWVLKPLGPIFEEELAVYLHHRRQASPDGLFHMMQYSLLQQLVRQDIKTYKIHVQLRRDNKTNLMAFPLCARLFEKGNKVNEALYEGNSQSFATGVPQFGLHDEIVFSHGCELTAVDLLPHCQKIIQNWFQGMKKTPPLVELKGKEMTAFEGYWKIAKPGTELAWTTTSTPAYGMGLVYKTGTPIRYHFVPGTSRLSISSGFLAFETPDKLENGASVKWVKAAHSSMKYQRKRLFWETEPHCFDFPAVRLTGLGPISDALVGRLEWKDPIVQYDRDVLLTATNSVINKMITDWQKVAIARVRAAWQAFQSVEQELFGKKSYFYCKEHNIANLSADEDIFNVDRDTSRALHLPSKGKAKASEARPKLAAPQTLAAPKSAPAATKPKTPRAPAKSKTKEKQDRTTTAPSNDSEVVNSQGEADK